MQFGEMTAEGQALRVALRDLRVRVERIGEGALNKAERVFLLERVIELQLMLVVL